MKSDKSEYGISIFGEFKDKNLEKEFFYDYLGRALRYMRPLVLALGILYLLFIIPDYFLIKNHNTFITIFINRTVYFVLVTTLFHFMKIVKNYTAIAYLVTICEILASISFLVIYTQYENPNFLIQSFGVMVIIMGVFLAPNRWFNMVGASALVSITFLLISSRYINNIKSSEFSAGIVYIFIILILSGIGAYRTSYYTRKQYAYSKELLVQSFTDPLTGIYNRAKFDEELKRWIEYSKRYKTSFTLVIFDFDNFKNVNDSYGHLIGDKVIIDTVNLIKESIRKTDMFARWGGEEFVLLFANTNKQQAVELTERLRLIIANHTYEGIVKITCSFGLVVFTEGDNADTLLNRADKLLYVAKKTGKNMVAR